MRLCIYLHTGLCKFAHELSMYCPRGLRIVSRRCIFVWSLYLGVRIKRFRDLWKNGCIGDIKKWVGYQYMSLTRVSVCGLRPRLAGEVPTGVLCVAEDIIGIGHTGIIVCYCAILWKIPFKSPFWNWLFRDLRKTSVLEISRNEWDIDIWVIQVICLCPAIVL